MKLGFCTDRNGLELAARAGCDYVEMSFTAVTRMEGADYAGLLQAVEDSGLAVEAMNGFIPGDFSLCSPDGGKGVMDFVLKGMDLSLIHIWCMRPSAGCFPLVYHGILPSVKDCGLIRCA